MNPHSDAHYELASAYLDNEATTSERAQVESTPELLALVASLRHVAESIALVPTAGHAVREAAIAAATGEYDTRHSNGNVISLAGRRRWPTAVMSAAAAVVLLGVVSISVLSNSDDKQSDTASVATVPKLEASTADDAVGAALPENSGGEVLVAMDAALAIEDPQDLLALPYPPVAPPADTAQGTDEDAQRSNNLDALACMAGNQVFLADIYFQGMLAIAVRDTVTGVTEAIDGSCTVLARVAP